MDASQAFEGTLKAIDKIVLAVTATEQSKVRMVFVIIYIYRSSSKGSMVVKSKHGPKQTVKSRGEAKSLNGVGYRFGCSYLTMKHTASPANGLSHLDGPKYPGTQQALDHQQSPGWQLYSIYYIS